MNEFEKFIEENEGKIEKIYREEHLERYYRNVQLTKIVLDNLSTKEYFHNLKEPIENLKKNIDDFSENIKNTTYQIAIVGAIKAGKSTLINALIGYELASVNVTPETATLTKFRHSEKNCLKVKFYTYEEWNKIWKSAKENNANIFLEEYKELNAESQKDKLLGKEEIYKEFNEISEMKSEITKWTSSQAKEHYFVKEIEIGLKELNLPSEICLVDTPGLNDVVEYRSQITRDYIDSANVVIVCVNAKTLRNEEMLTIVRVFDKARYKKEKIFILGTQIDTMNSLNDWEIQRRNWIKMLKTAEYFENKELAEKNLIGISAYTHFKLLKIGDKLSRTDIRDLNKLKVIDDNEDDNLIEKAINNEITKEITENIKNKARNFSKIEYLRKIINNEILENYQENLLVDFKEKYEIIKEEILAFSSDNIDKIEEMSDTLKKSREEVLEIIKKARKDEKELKEKNKELKEKIKEVNHAFNLDLKDFSKNFDKLKDKIGEINIEI